MNRRFTYPSLTVAALLALTLFFAGLPTPVNAGGGGFFAPRGRTLNQPGQQVFITYDAGKQEESYTISPRFEGNAVDFGVLYPIPSRPKLDEMSADFFPELDTFTILKPQDTAKYALGAGRGGEGGAPGAGGRGAGAAGFGGAAPARTVVVLETGVVGTLDYKIISADKADDLYAWLKDNNYAYAGDEATLDYYIQKKWVFVAMKIAGNMMKQRPDGTYQGQVTPTRFTFTSDQLVFPLRMTQLSVKDKTDILFYVQTANKVDLGGDFSYQCTFVPMWVGAMSSERGTAVTAQEFAWNQLVGGLQTQYSQSAQAVRASGHVPAVCLWAKEITDQDVSMITGALPYDRSATPDKVEKLKLLDGYVAKGQFLTKIRKIFTKDEMSNDLVFADAQVKGKPDRTEYFATLPTTAQAIVDYSTLDPVPNRGARGANRGPAPASTGFGTPPMSLPNPPPAASPSTPAR